MNPSVYCIPSKTFLIGEYAALQAMPAMLLTTTPCFAVAMHTEPPFHLHGIHEASPAGRFWRACGFSNALFFQDPYQGLGGLGGSSAQFVGAYRAACELQAKPFSFQGLLDAYQNITGDQQGILPSGYDVLAQASSTCVYIESPAFPPLTFSWPFDSLTFLLLHTGTKCKTHEHLLQLHSLQHLNDLKQLVEQAWLACVSKQSEPFLAAINAYATALAQRGWVLDSTQHWRSVLKHYPGVRAVKGCGAMGADVLLVVLEQEALSQCLTQLTSTPLRLLATKEELYP